MLEERGKKHWFACQVCRGTIELLSRPELFVNGVVRFMIRHRCRACEHNGAIVKGEKQIFFYTPDVVVRRTGEELIPASEKYV